jgi:hypothetical protein
MSYNYSNGYAWYEPEIKIIEPQAIICLSEIDTPAGIMEMIEESKERMRIVSVENAAIMAGLRKRYFGRV